MKKAKLFEVISILALVAMVVLAYYFNGVLPDQVISHWNAQGQADDYSSKTFFVYFMPLLSIGVYLLMKYLPKVDPKKANYIKFDTAYNFLRLYLVLFFLVIFYVSGMMNLDFGKDWNMGQIMPVVIAILFVCIGLIMPQIKQNWFAGIKTPWTLSDNENWEKTHRFGGKMFILGGLVFLSMAFLPSNYFIVVFVVAIAIILSPILYSYFIFRNSQKLPPEEQK
ncbi:hypothetical protein C0580_01460 [Candidatus Parcubacteria bacterium]|nr:MAG: hypothetical protein C0580_01460 [Candidatus Parcubacteria bacterium]